jgi:hypothetical protein
VTVRFASADCSGPQRPAPCAAEASGPRLALMRDDLPIPYRVVLASGPLSPAEDLDTAIIAARQSQALGQAVERIEQGGEIVLEGDELSEAIANLPIIV